MKLLNDVLQGQQANYILPFLWQKGEEEGIIREEMARVQASGIGAVCVEARPHPDFYGPQWWHDIDIIMDEARRRGMRVWLLDDDHFPTGHAIGKMKNAPADLQRLFLKEQHFDAVGPQQGASFTVASWYANLFGPPDTPKPELVAIIAVRRDAASDQLLDEYVDLTDQVKDDRVRWNIPAGYWRIFIVFTTTSGGSAGQKDYINPLIAGSTRVLIDAVYVPFYARYKADFGATFAGFFSDEPGFYNDPQTFDFLCKPGKRGVGLPWSADTAALLANALGDHYQHYLPLLWHDDGAHTSTVHFAYMDIVSRLYGINFTQQVGDWCRAHHVDYIGHVLEDNGVHTRLGPGAGHYFRALWGQDMAGIDIVLHQLVPGFDSGPVANISGDADGEFYHYGVAKLASSLAHIDPKKRGRAMCELFGAYGWREGLKLMKWMTDHLLTRGINVFVPHAFSQAPFPDRDCPPHMYAHGMNPQYRYYHELNDYTNRIAHLLSGGRHIASAAVLYHAEGEWSATDEKGWMPFHKPVRELTQHQIDCDVIPIDILLDASKVIDGKLAIADETYACLIVPYCQTLPVAALDRLATLATGGLPILFINSLPTPQPPSTTIAVSAAEIALQRLRDNANVHIVTLVALAEFLRCRCWCDITVKPPAPHLRYYHVQQVDCDVFMFSNEHPYDVVNTSVEVPLGTTLIRYDALANKAHLMPFTQTERGARFELHLVPYESVLIIAGEVTSPYNPAPARHSIGALQITGDWHVATATSQQYPVFTPAFTVHVLADMLPAFSGTLRYETTFECANAFNKATLDLGDVYETAEVWLNGHRAGVRICPPYQFDVDGMLKAGANTLIVEVTNTLVKEQSDFLSRYMPQEPSGLLGPVQLLIGEVER